jgi:hypothetical protein
MDFWDDSREQLISLVYEQKLRCRAAVGFPVVDEQVPAL